jgi:hypothetical protein
MCKLSSESITIKMLPNHDMSMFDILMLVLEYLARGSSE